MSLIYKPDTLELVRRTANTLPHALLLQGARGVGLATTARSLAGPALVGYIQATDTKGVIDTTTKGIIRIVQIRELVEQTKGKFTTPQIYVIDNADKMNVQAQNAFLKLLEEPAPNTHFILTSHQPHLLLATILSRVQRLTIQQIDREASRHLIDKLGVRDAKKTEQLLFLAAGKPAELTRLVQDDALFTHRANIMADARVLVQGTLYQKTLIAARYYSDRVEALTLLELAQSIITFSLKTNPPEQLVATLNKLTTTYERIAANGNTRLQLMNFVIQ